MIALAIYNRTPTILRHWADAGYRCISVDIQPASEPYPGIEHVQADVLTWIPPRGEYAACFAFPPCTDLSVSGARWFPDKGLGRLARAIELVERGRQICEWTGAPGFLENPVSTISSYWRKPDFRFNPSDYGDPWTKLTCLWAFGGFTMPPKTPVEPTQGSKMHLMPPSDERANLRSATPPGFSRAVFMHLTSPNQIRECA